MTTPIGSAGVGPNAGPPRGAYWDRLAEASTAADLDALEAEVRRHGYQETGQLRTAIAAKRQSLTPEG